MVGDGGWYCQTSIMLLREPDELATVGCRKGGKMHETNFLLVLLLYRN